MSEKYTLRRATSADIPEIESIFNAARAFMASQNNPQWQDGYPYADVIKSAVEGGNFRVLEMGGKAAAVFSVFEGDEEYDDICGKWLTGKERRYIAAHTLAVSPDFRGMGLARAAVREAEREAKERGFISVRMDTHTKNAPMRSLLLSEGFTFCGNMTVPGRESFICFEKLV